MPLTNAYLLRNGLRKCGRCRRNAGHMTDSDDIDHRCCGNDTSIRDSSKYDWLRRMCRRCACTCQVRRSSTYTGDTRHSRHTWREHNWRHFEMLLPPEYKKITGIISLVLWQNYCQSVSQSINQSSISGRSPVQKKTPHN